MERDYTGLGKTLTDKEKKEFDKLKDLNKESGIISTLIYNPQFIFHSENLNKEDFYDQQNMCFYWAIKQLVSSGVKEIDEFNLTNMISTVKWTEDKMKNFDLSRIKEILEFSRVVSRKTIEEYKQLATDVKNLSNRRKLFLDTKILGNLCLENKISSDELQKETFKIAEKYTLSNSSNKEIRKFADKVDELWQEIQDRQNGKLTSIPFHIKELNEYVMMEAGELIIFGASAKEGKSAMLLSSTVDLLKKGLNVLILDSELSDRLYLLRLLAHVSQVPFKKVKDGTANKEESERIEKAKEWIKSVNFYHEYVPVFNDQDVMMLFKRANCLNKIDVCVIDYFKQTTGTDAFEVSMNLSNFVNTIKNELAGVYKIPVISAIQTTKNGDVALSKGVIRYCSTLIAIRRKTQEEFIKDGGADYGNSYMSVKINRNGAQQNEGEHISVDFIGDLLTYKSAKKQPEKISPY